MLLLASLSGCQCGVVVERTSGELRVRPSYVDFGVVGPGMRRTRAIELENAGRSALKLESMELGQGALGFSVGAKPQTIQPGELASVELTFEGQSTAGVTATALTVTSDFGTVLVALRAESELVASQDAGIVDAGVVDAGVVDAGIVDAGIVDAGIVDAGIVDAGVVDAGVVDAGVVDAGVVDAGVVDAGVDRGCTPGFVACITGCCPAGPSGFSPTGALSTARWWHTATLLNDGRVLVVGGANGPLPVASAELYDPSTGVFTPLAFTPSARDSHTATLLPDGTVLLAGGRDGTAVPTNTVEKYEPATGRFVPMPPMTVARQLFTATLLPSGLVLFTGGDGTLGPGATAELYNATTGATSGVMAMSSPRQWHSATLLPNGKVLIAGGTSTLVNAELFDPATGRFTATGMPSTLRLTQQEATLLASGTVLIGGGEVAPELYDPATGQFSPVTSTLLRSWPTQTRLRSGKVLFAGGYAGSIATSSAGLLDPAMSSVAVIAQMGTARGIHSATLLADGRVLLVGGRDGATMPVLACELFQE
ncbi:MAG: kelch repeat-containing protein [Archangium sp.]|nr:kelch repeat-containing protein [Archangium sp.]